VHESVRAVRLRGCARREPGHASAGTNGAGAEPRLLHACRAGVRALPCAAQAANAQLRSEVAALRAAAARDERGRRARGGSGQGSMRASRSSQTLQGPLCAGGDQSANRSGDPSPERGHAGDAKALRIAELACAPAPAGSGRPRAGRREQGAE